MKKIENSPATIHKVEEQSWRGFSVFLHVVLPIAGLALLLGQKGIFAKLLLRLDRSCVAVYCPSLSKREKLLKWASERLPSTWSSQAKTLSSGIPELWKDGSLLCTLINSVVPGACPNPHRHWRKPPLHAQALAYKYLGLVPMFTEDELSGEFTINHERNFIQYLERLQEIINKWSTKDELSQKFSSQYVARGMGLYTGEQHRKTVFYLYSNASAKRRSSILMYIRGPYGTQGKATISPFHNLKTIPVVNVLQDQLEATKMIPFRNQEQKSFLKTISLDFTSLISSVEDKSEKSNIPIQIEMEIDRAKITYIPKDTGIYEINLISNGELLRGSPYLVQIVHNSSGIKDNFNTEYDKVEEKITFTKRKILSKVIDCIDEKICIENNKVSKIKFKDLTESSTESDTDDLTITAITKKDDEILKTEINCTLEDIIEEIHLIQDQNSVNNIDGLTEIKKIAEQLKTDVPKIMDFKTNDIVDGLKIDPQHKLVNDPEEARSEIVDLLQKDYDDQFDYNNEMHQEIDSVTDNTSISKLDFGFVNTTKYIKNLINAPSEPKSLQSKENHLSQDENDNFPVKRIKSKIYFEVSPKISKTTSVSFPNITSPICPSNIVPEVEKTSLNQLSLSEKRKTFSKQDSFNLPDCDVSFSNSENENLSKSKDSTFRQLSVLNVLDTLRKSRNGSFSENYALTTTVSLPNINSFDSNLEHVSENTFKARKDYWERLSSRSSSNFSLTNSDNSQDKNNIKNFLNKYNTIEKDLSKSTNNMQTQKNLKENVTKVKINNYKQKSIDSSLEDCTIIPLEERKKLLLKDYYERETKTRKKPNLKLNFYNKSEDNEVSQMKKIQNFDQSNTKSNLNQNLEISKEPKKTTKHIIKSHFKKAINFFKNLEENSKSKEKNKTNIKRRYSLDFQKNSNRKNRSGSLNLPNISDRFSINNLYEDVFGSQNGSFRGTPKKSELVDALASLSKEFPPKDSSNREENSISYNLFANTAKSKKRKSVKGVFDVNY